MFKETLEFFGGDELRARVFLDKYALRVVNRQNVVEVVEKTPLQTWERLARALAQREDEVDDYLWLLSDFKFVPAGRILFSVGNDYVNSTPFNCFFIPIVEDSIEGIFRCAQEMARTYSWGGGVGTDVSVLRPAGARVNNTAFFSTGPVSFMELFSTVTGIIGQNHRRGALMLSIHDWHPDVELFINCKNDPERRAVRFANISVMVSDEFMECVQKGKQWQLRFNNYTKVVDAQELFNKLVEAAWASAEPGVLFYSRHVEFSNSEMYPGGHVIGVNPCSEQVLPAYGACNLGSLNLAYFARDGQVDYRELERAVRLAVRFLDAVIDYAEKKGKFPLPAQRDREVYERRIGLGIMGLADMLFLCGLRYDEDRALELVNEVMRFICETSYAESVRLAAERGPAPAFQHGDITKAGFIQKVIRTEFPTLYKQIVRQGMRNIAVLSVAPTGSISLMAGVSSGIEPIFAPAYIRRFESISAKEVTVWHPALRDYLRKEHKVIVGYESRWEDYKHLFPPHFVTAHQIDPIKRVEMQGVVQYWVDAAISSTVNFPEHATVDDIRKVYMEAWRRGCKGITVYREGSREGILLTKKEEGKGKSQVVVQVPVKFKRPARLLGETMKVKSGMGNLYVTVNYENEGEKRKIREVFIHLGKAGTQVNALVEALGRILSVALQHGVPAGELIKQLQGIKAGEGVRQEDGVVTFSVPDAVAYAIESVAQIDRRENHTDVAVYDLCHECGGVLVKIGSCVTCLNCGYSTCY